MKPQFSAPWSKALKLISLGVSVIPLVGLSTAYFAIPDKTSLVWVMFVILPVGFYVGSLLFVVTGYEVSSSQLQVKRLLWTTNIDLNDLTSVKVTPLGLFKSWRVFGNGGFFSFTGWFRNKDLGTYRAFITDHERGVVLRFSDKKPIVVSPDEPQRFQEYLSELKNLA